MASEKDELASELLEAGRFIVGLQRELLEERTEHGKTREALDQAQLHAAGVRDELAKCGRECLRLDQELTQIRATLTERDTELQALRKSREATERQWQDTCTQAEDAASAWRVIAKVLGHMMGTADEQSELGAAVMQMLAAADQDIDQFA